MWLAATAVARGQNDAQQRLAWEIRPLLSDRCFQCHGPDNEHREADLRLDEPDGLQRVIDLQMPEQSELLRRIRSADPDEVMPPPHVKKPIRADQVQQVADWIRAGAPWSDHWAFQPIERPQLPAVHNRAWTRNAVDRFVLRQLEQRQIEPSPEASKSTLLRRVYLDLLGLLPSVTDLERFESDSAPGAYERLVDRLLASPHYGERWGRHWLDQARYADSDGYAIDNARVMWPYRDWVLAAINQDMPFDRFTIEQLAGDLLPDATPAQQIATGFHRNTLINQEGGTDPEQFRNEAVVDRVNTTGAVWLGLTLACAQCHTHKFDPISHREYFQLFAFFNSSVDRNSHSPEMLVVPEDQQNRWHELQQQGDAQESLRTFEAKFPRAMIMRDLDVPRRSFVHERGDFLREGESVTANTPAVLPPLNSAASPPSRLDLARWLVNNDNPLTARVAVNRVWMRLFGRGIVETENDFGTQGTPPSHPLLLDWLAAEFADHDWSLKRLHRAIAANCEIWIRIIACTRARVASASKPKLCVM
jgi:mono/diheme cytochrome c family protein